MKPEEIKLNDWVRIFEGLVPASFYLELVIRAALILTLLVVCMRLLGKRMSAHLTQLELVALVSLASAIGVPMLAPDRGLLPSILIAMIVVGISWAISKISFSNKRFEKATQGNAETLLEDGVMQYKRMKQARISRERLFAHLRSEGVQQIGEVKRVYLETNGLFTLIKNKTAAPGLMVLPDWDDEFVKSRLKECDVEICKNCGARKTTMLAEEQCNLCGDNDWVKARFSK